MISYQALKSDMEEIYRWGLSSDIFLKDLLDNFVAIGWNTLEYIPREEVDEKDVLDDRYEGDIRSADGDQPESKDRHHWSTVEAVGTLEF